MLFKFLVFRIPCLFKGGVYLKAAPLKKIITCKPDSKQLLTKRCGNIPLGTKKHCNTGEQISEAGLD